MGLDITAYRKVQPVRPIESGEEGNGRDDNLVTFLDFKEFAGRFEGLKEDTLYSFDEEYDFRAGSYSGYNSWREWLAKLAGYPPTMHKGYGGHVEYKCAAACWNGTTGPFYELIDFADNEGTIGPVVAAKLAKDFAEWDERAKAASADEPRFYEKYQDWRKAMEMAADGGAVDFH